MEITVPVSSITFDSMNKTSLKVAMRRFRKQMPCELVGTKSVVKLVRPHRHGEVMVGIRIRVNAHRDDYPLLEAIRNRETDVRINMSYKGFTVFNKDTGKPEVIVRSILGFRINHCDDAKAKREYQ